MTSGSVTRPILRLSALFALSSMLNLVPFIVDRKFVGQVGTASLAALGVAHAALMILVTFALGMALGTLAGVARRIGAGRADEAARVVVQGIYVGLAFGLCLLALAFVVPNSVLAAMGVAPEVTGPASAYLAITMGGMVFHAPLLMCAFALQGAGLARAALVLSAVPAVLHAAIDPVFIFSLGLGAPGAAWAGVVAHAVGLALGAYLLKRSPLRPGPGGWAFDRALTLEVTRVGIFGSLEQVVRTTAGFGLVSFLAPFGATVLSAWSSGQVVLMALITPGIAIGQATATLVGQNLGAGKPARAWRTVWTSVALYLALMLAACLVVYALPGPFIAAFDAEPLVVEEGARMLRVVVLCFPFIAVAMVLSRAFAGASETRPAMAVAAFAHLLVQLPVVAVLTPRMGPTGAYVGLVAAFVVHGLLALALFTRRFGAWRSAAA
ncbi:MAG: MATE family efflux transporter [Bradymonadia bacterium]